MQINSYSSKLHKGNFVATDAMDVGDVSDRYDHAECQIVHAVYERGNECAAEKNEPIFDNRVGFTDMKSADGSRLRAGVFSGNRGAGLNDPSPTPPQEVREVLQQAAQESARLDSPERTNDSTIAPNMPKQDILKGFHGG